MNHHTVTLCGARLLRGLRFLWLVVWAWPLTQQSQTKGLWHRSSQVFCDSKTPPYPNRTPRSHEVCLPLEKSGAGCSPSDMILPFSELLLVHGNSQSIHPSPALLSVLKLTSSTHPRSHSTLFWLQLYQVGLHGRLLCLYHWHPPWYSKVSIWWRAWVKGSGASLQGAGESLNKWEWWSDVNPEYQEAAGRNPLAQWCVWVPEFFMF